MINQQVLQGKWNEVKGKIRSKWGQLTDDDVARFNGDVNQLVGAIQRKTGESRESVERFLNELTDETSAAAQSAESGREAAHQVANTIQSGTREGSEMANRADQSVREGYEGAEELVRRRPAESAAICFGVGILAGLFVALAVHRN